jgi:hypothetical protein
MLVGMAVDYGRILAAKQQSQVLLDNAALAGGRSAQLAASSERLTAAGTTASSYFAANTVPHTVGQPATTTLTGPVESTPGEYTWTSRLFVPTPFMSAAQILPLSTLAPWPGQPSECGTSGWNCFPVEVKTTVLIAQSGQNDGYDMETSLMLDITGSMDGTKITDLRVAAKDLIDIVVWEDQSQHKSRVAIAPFSSHVNVGSYAATVTGKPANPSLGSQLTSSGGNASNGQWAGPSSGSWLLRPCVVERLGTNAATDEAPNATNGWIGSHGANNAPSGYSYTSSMSSADWDYSNSGTCVGANASSAIVPLTATKTTLKDRIDTMQVGGGTAGHLGTAWAWYMLSPKWNSIWPTESQPGAYSGIAAKTLKKIAILMTDGDYNTDYSDGSSQDKAYALCVNMRNTGIEVYTVGFQVSEAAKTFLKSCATQGTDAGASHYYDAVDGEALKAAFRDIALKITPIFVKK